MKKILYTIALILGLQVSLTAQENEKVAIRVPNFARPLVEKWVAEYQKVNSGVDFQFVTAKSQDTDNIIQFTTDGGAVYIARYAVLPITASESQAQQLIGTHKLNAKRLKTLFFVDEDLDDDEADTKEVLHVYTGNGQQSVSRVYASHFKQTASDYKGKKIAGDDSFLNTAVSRDPLGVTVNTLSNIADLNSRQLKPELALLPLDVDKESRQILSEGQLDAIINLLEQRSFDEIPVGKVGLTYNRNNARINDFVQWIMAYGIQYVHEYGFLELPKKELTAQLHKAE